MKICVISDTHGEHKELKPIPNCDVLIHCGDITPLGREHSVIDFLDWFKSLEQCKYKIFVAGNHDFLFDMNKKRALELIPDNVIYLEDDRVIIDGVKFYGTPHQLPKSSSSRSSSSYSSSSISFHNWAFNKRPGIIKEYWDMIPNDVDVLITHCPPKGIMDLAPWGKVNIGSETLLEKVNVIKPKIHCFGHLHDCYGIMKINDTVFINASNLNEEYEIANNPILIEI